MAFRRHDPQWIGVWREDTNSYYGSGSVRVGGYEGFNSLIGFNSSSLLDDIQTSKVRARVHLRFNVTNAATFDLGMHKTASNPSGGGLPFYRWTGRSLVPDVGEATYDITDFPVSIDGSDSFEGTLIDGYHGPVLYGDRDAGDYGTANSVYIEVEGVWNEPPSVPDLAYPTGGETLSGTITATANGSMDPEGDTLTYQFALKDADGWHYFNRGGLDKTIDLSNYKETSQAQVAVRAHDGQSYSDFDYSGVFTLSENIPPSQPQLIEPVGGESIDRTEPLVFRWQHIDSELQSLFRLRWREQGTETWNLISAVTFSEYYPVSPNTFPAGDIEWQVQTEDQGGLASPWSNTGVFLATEQSDAPTITTPTDGATVPQDTLNVGWSSSGQVQFEVEVLEGSELHWIVTRSSGNKGITIGEPLLNNTTYTIRVRIADSGGLWSAWASVTVTTSFTPPTQAELSTQSHEEQASIYIDVFNPLPGGTQPDAQYNDLYRRAPGEQWIRIASRLNPNTGFMDYTPAGNVVYEYYVITMGANETTMNSVPVIGTVNIENTFLSVAAIPTTFIELDKVKPQTFSRGLQSATMQFSGRKNPVTQFGEMTNDNLSLDILIEFEKFKELESILSARQTLLYRDEQGDKRYISVSSFSTSYLNPNYYGVQFSPITVDYSEEV